MSSPLKGRPVVFTCDLSRSGANRLKDVAENLFWLERALGPVFAREGCRIGQLHPQSAGGVFDAAAFMAAAEAPPNRQGWVGLYPKRELPAAAEAMLDEAFDPRAFVVGFGMAPWMMHFFRRRGVEFADFEVDPVRFCRGAFFRGRTNASWLEQRFRDIEVPAEEIDVQARLIRAGHARGPGWKNFSGFGGVSVFAGQMDFDAALVADGRLHSLDEHLPALEAAARSADLLLVRPHPHMRKLANLEPLLRAIPNTVVTSHPTYELLSLENVREVIALSSSVLSEAPFFGQAASALIRPDFLSSSIGAGVVSREYRLGVEMLDAGTWRPAPPAVAVPRARPDLDMSFRESYQTLWGGSSKNGFAVKVGEPLSGRGDLRDSGFFSFGWRTSRSGEIVFGGREARLCFRVEGGAGDGLSARIRLAAQDREIPGFRISFVGAEATEITLPAAPGEAGIELKLPASAAGRPVEIEMRIVTESPAAGRIVIWRDFVLAP